MTITEAIEQVKKDGKYTDENVSALKKAVLGTDLTGFQDPKLKEFINFINEMDFDERIQDIVNGVVSMMAAKGVLSPCMGGCSDECAFHEAEFGN